jgi:hypothetical protein
MKKISLLKCVVLTTIMMCCATTGFAQSVGTFADFDAALTALKSTEGGGTIVLTTTITIAEDYTIASDADHPIIITMGTNSIKIDGVTNNSETSYTLTIGDNVTFNTTGGAISNANRGKINIIGGVVNCTNGTPINFAAGNGSISGGTFTSSSNRLVQVNSGYSVTIFGGTFKVTSTGAAGRCVYASGENTKVNITGGTFEANSNTLGSNVGIGILVDQDNVSCVATVSGATFTGTGVAFRAQKSSRIIIREANTDAVATVATIETNAKI